jgi:GPH family glycoside/pentoside/hexuronide:cation symporter
MNNEKITIKEKLGYSLGDVASNLFFQTFLFYLMFFYTDVFGISAGVAGTMVFITRIWDTVNDPLMGMIGDRTRSKWGKFRPYLLWMAVPFGVFGSLMFMTPDLSMTGKIIYAYVTYSLMMMGYTAINIPYSALLGVITSDSIERTSFSAYRFVGAFAGGLCVQATLIYLVEFFGKGNQQKGYHLTMTLYALLAVGLWLITFFNTKERVQPMKTQKTSLINDLKDLFNNRPWVVLFFLGIFTLTFACIRNGATMYYFKYYVGDEKLSTFFITAGTVASLLGTMLTKPMSKWFGKRTLYLLLMITNSVMVLLFYFVQAGQFVLMFTLHLIGSFCNGPTSALVWAMYADTADYSEWKTGRRATGLVFSAASFAQKMGWTVGGGLAGWLLAYFGFQANMVQTPETLQGIRLLMSFIPAAAGVMAVVCILFYNLKEPFVKKITQELEERRTKENQEGE